MLRINYCLNKRIIVRAQAMNRCTQYIINKYITMKIYQIISEAPPTTPSGYTTSAGGIVVPNQVATQQKQATAQATQQAAALAQQQAAQKAATRQGRVDTAKSLAYAKANPVKGKLYSMLGIDTKGKLTDKDLAKLRDHFLADKKYKQTAQGKWEGKFGVAVRSALGALQVAGSCIELYTVRAAADDMQQNGELSPANAQIVRDFALRKFTQEVAAQIGLWAASAKVAKYLIFIVRTLLALVGVATAGTSLAALVASEIAMQAFLAYIKTEEGRDYFARYLGGILIDDDSLIGSTTGKILDYIGLATKVPGQPAA